MKLTDTSQPFSSESMVVFEVREELNWNNPIELLPEQPIPVYPSNLEYGEPPLGYMWSDGIMTLTEDRGSKIIKRKNEYDEWIPTKEESVFNQLLEVGQISALPEKSETYILKA